MENKGSPIIIRNPTIQYVNTVKTVVPNASYHISKRQLGANVGPPVQTCHSYTLHFQNKVVVFLRNGLWRL